VTEQVSIVSPRLDAKPWGGRRLETLGIALPAEERIGEALLTANEAEVIAGAFSGQTLGSVVEADPVTALGSRGLAAVGGRATFPLLAKLIDASENLSIQVHPNDDQAAPLEISGKNFPETSHNALHFCGGVKLQPCAVLVVRRHSRSFHAIESDSISLKIMGDLLTKRVT
jgi:mannose-6-phosphate isomerase class I